LPLMSVLLLTTDICGLSEHVGFESRKSNHAKNFAKVDF
jgi:hypothetical protein